MIAVSLADIFKSHFCVDAVCLLLAASPYIFLVPYLSLARLHTLTCVCACVHVFIQRVNLFSVIVLFDNRV